MGSSCDPPKVSGVRLMPEFVCPGQVYAGGASWNCSNCGGGRAVVRSASGEELCNVAADARMCSFGRSITANDMPVRLEGVYQGEIVGGGEASVRVLSGPSLTHRFAHDRSIPGRKPVPITETRYEYEPCDDEQDPTRVCDQTVGPCPDNADGRCLVPTNCRCLVLNNEVVQVEAPSVSAFLWNLSGLFGPRVITHELRYVRPDNDGCQVAPGGDSFADSLEFVGPGINGRELVALGETAFGNRENPSGSWIGHVQDGDVVLLSPDGEPLYSHFIQLMVACEDE